MDPGDSLSTIRLMTTIIFGLQAVVIGLQIPLAQRYGGIVPFFWSAVLLAAGSALLLFEPVLAQGGPGPMAPLGLGPGGGPPPLDRGPQGVPWVGLASSLFTLVGTAVQYTALARFFGRRPSRTLMGVVAVLALVLFLVDILAADPVPFVPLREALGIPLLAALVRQLVTANVAGFRLGAVVTGLPFLGDVLLSAFRVSRGLTDSSWFQPGPHLNNEIDALILFALSFLWTAGFLLMVNQRLQSDLRALAAHDPLTGALNRRAAADFLAVEAERFARYGRPFSVILLDLDRFKAINDTEGHHTGDRVLVGTAAVLRQGLRSGDRLSRWGGEEFLILLPETQAAEALPLAERLRAQVEAHEFGLTGRNVTFSAGVASLEAGETPDEVCARADQALYQAKVTRNRVVAASSPAHPPAGS